MLVEQLLRSKGLTFKVQGKDFVIQCLNPEHEDTNPSCRVDRITGLTHCFSCGWSADIFKYYGILGNINNIKATKLKEKLDNLTISNSSLQLPENYSSFKRLFRNITPATYAEFEAFITTDIEKLIDRVCFPIRDISGNIVAFIGRHILSDGNPRYQTYPGGKALPLVPTKLKNNSKYLVLVEGIFDMLNLYDKGLHSVAATMGTNGLNKNNINTKLLPFKAQGVEKIYIAFDGDTAGRTAAKELLSLLENEGWNAETIDLDDDVDPGNLSRQEVETLIRLIKNEETYSDN